MKRECSTERMMASTVEDHTETKALPAQAEEMADEAEWIAALPAIRKKQAELLIAAVGERLAQAERWRERLAKGQEAAEAAKDHTMRQTFERLAALFAQSEALLAVLDERARLAAESMKGVFYSSDLLADLSESLREWGLLGSEWQSAVGDPLAEAA